jgi:hypothetical protein
MVIRKRFVCNAVIAQALLAVMLSGAAVGGGLDPESNTDGFDPAVESYRINEARRQNLINRQLDLIYLMQWENPYFPGEDPIQQPIGYESKQVSPNRWIYRPIYPENVAPAPSTNEALPEPVAAGAPAAEPVAPAPADAASGDFIPPKAVPKTPAARGPRKF